MAPTPSVLVVDDEPIVGKRLKGLLSSIGCEVEVFSVPSQALYRLQQREFDIVITDVKMDELSGMQILERSLGLYPRIKVIMITGYAMMELARRAMEMGAFDFIAKPFTPDELRTVVRRAAAAAGVPLIVPGEEPQE